MNSKLAVSLVGLALLVGLVLFFVLDQGDGRRVRDTGSISAAAPLDPEIEAPLVRADSLAIEAPGAASREIAREATEAAAPVPWRGELAGIIGRVVEPDGAPVPGVRVALLEFDASLLFDGSALDEERRSLELEQIVTDREGRFVMGGARSPAFHGLGIDLGGPRATVRIIDRVLPHRERTDLGDIVLAPFGVLSGRIVDETGAPVVGARVRAGPFPEQVLIGTPYEYRSQSLIAVSILASKGDGQGVIEPPPWIREAIDRFPIPTTYSSDDGTFRLEGVALGNVIGGADKPGLVGAPIGPVDLSDGDHDVGDLVLTAGRTLSGVVEDAFGEPIAGAEVFAGAEIAPGTAAILQPCGMSDEDGEFTLTGVPLAGQIVAAARRHPYEPWGVTFTTRDAGVTVELPSLVRLALNVRSEAGEPLSNTRILARPGHSSEGGMMGMSEMMSFLPSPQSPKEAFREVEAGLYVNDRLSAGTYDLQVRAPGLAPVFQQVECLGENNEVTVTCGPGTLLDVTVVDSVTKAPIEGARASVMRFHVSGLVKLATGRSDALGQVRLGPLADFAEEGGERRGMPSETTLLVQHPRYGDHSAKLESRPGPRVVEMQGGGVLEGRVHWGGAVPTRIYMLTLATNSEDDLQELFHLPRLTLTGLEGEFRVADLDPGKYQVALIERFLDQDPMGLMVAQFSPTTLHQEEIEIRNGETTTLVIDLTPSGRGATARLLGRVRVDGRPLEGAEVTLRGAESVSVVTDARGRFETGDFAVRGSTRLRVSGEVRLPGGTTQSTELHDESLELERDEIRELNLDFYLMTLRAQVVDATTGDPVPGAKVLAQATSKGFNSWQIRNKGRETNGRGEVELVLLETGKYSVSAVADGFAQGSTPIEVLEGGPSDVTTVRLKRSLPCSGFVRFAGPAPEGGFAYMWVEGGEEGGGVSAGVQVILPEYTFTLDGLSEGKYTAHFYIGGQQGEPQTFELGPNGDTNLELIFLPAGEPAREK